MSEDQTECTFDIDAASYLTREHERTFRWDRAIAEMVDNAFDQNATCVRIEFNSKNKMFACSDDGKGAPELERFLKLGKHEPSKQNPIGRYGVGLKDAAIGLWGKMKVVTAFENTIRQATIDWQDCVDRNKFLWIRGRETEHNDIEAASCGMELGLGTTISFRSIVRKMDTAKRDELIGYLSLTYSSALQSHRTIEFSYNGKVHTVKPMAWPSLTGRIDEEFFVKGKHVKLVAGLVAEGESNPAKGFIIICGPRVIEISKRGTQGFNPSQFFASVELGAGWRLERNKADVTDYDVDELFEALGAKCSHLLAASTSAASTVHVNNIASMVEASLNSALSEFRHAKRKKTGTQSGTVTPSGSGKEHRKATNRHTSPGKYLPKLLDGTCTPSGFQINFDKQGDGRIGVVERAGPTLIVTLYSDHPSIAMLNTLPSEQSSNLFKMLACGVIAVSASDQVKGKQLQPLLFKNSDVEPMEVYAKLMAGALRNIEATAAALA